MRVNEWLDRGQKQLETSGIGTVRLDSLVLLEDITNKDRSWLLAHPEHELPTAQIAKLTKLLKRRALHEPLAYIRGRGEFYGRTFVLTPAVLEPRPESETMIELLKALPLFHRLEVKHGKLADFSHASIRIADVGTGSGALGITAALELPQTEVELLEIDSNALEVVQINVDLFTLNIRVIKSDLLANCPNNYDVLLCNLPYVPDGHTVNLAASHEPKIAIFGGPDGLDLYRKLFKQIKTKKHKPLYILTEAMPPQHNALASIAMQADYRLTKNDDFIQVFQLSRSSAKPGRKS